MERRGTELDTDDLPNMTVKNLRDHFGQFLKLHAVYAGVQTAGASSLPSATDRLMQAQRYQSRALPAQPNGSAYEFRLFRALLANLCCDELSFPLLDAEQSGKRSIKSHARERLSGATLLSLRRLSTCTFTTAAGRGRTRSTCGRCQPRWRSLVRPSRCRRLFAGGRKQRQRAAGAKFWSNHFKTGGVPCILATQATAKPPLYPITGQFF